MVLSTKSSLNNRKGGIKISKIMLITSPLVTNKMDLKKSAMNNGLLYIGSFLRNNGHDVRLVDTIFEGWDNIRYKKGNIIEYGLSDNKLERKIDDYDPNIIGLNLLATVSYGGFIRQIKKLKRRFPNKIFIAGGAHLTALPEKTLRDSQGSLDYLIHGEGEKVVLNIANNLNNKSEIRKLNGIAYLDEKGRFIINEREKLISNLDDIGHISIDLVKDIPYTPEPTYAGPVHGKKYADLMLSRGCPLNCSFCFTPQMWERVFRTHSVDWISDTLDRYIDAGFSHFIIQDDNFSRGGDWTYNVMNLFREKEVTWEDNGGLEMENLTPDIVRYMSDTNCTTLFIPLNIRTEKTNKIPEKIKQHYKNILSVAKHAGIHVYTSHIMGFPEQTFEGMKMQAKFAKDLVDSELSDFHVVYAYSVLPGTRRFYQVMESIGNGEYKVREGSGITFYGGWQNWPLYSVNSPQIGSVNFSYEEFREEYYNTIKYINGAKADIWFDGREWPK